MGFVVDVVASPVCCVAYDSVSVGDVGVVVSVIDAVVVVVVVVGVVNVVVDCYVV